MARRLRPLDETWASFGIPIGLAFFIHSSASGAVVALYPSPAGATESELDLERLARPARANPVLEGLEPDAEALIVNRMAEPPAARDRPDRRVLPAGRDDQARPGMGSRAAPGSSGPSSASSASCARGRRRMSVVPDADALDAGHRGRSPVRPDPEFEILARAPSSAPPPRPCASPSRATDDSGRRVFTIALTAAISIEPAKRRYDGRDPRAAGRAVRRARALGVDHARASAGPRPTRSCRSFDGRPSSSSSSPAPTTSRSRRPSTSTGSPTARRRCAFTSTARSSTRPTRDRMQIVQIPWDRSPRFRCRSRPGAG